MKRYYLIDFENVGKKFLKGVEYLNTEDTVYLYHNLERGASASPDVVNQLNLTKATIKIIPVYRNTINAMDFELVAHLGFLIGQNGNYAEYHIVSEDKGYVAAIDFLKNETGTTAVIDMVSDFGKIPEKNFTRESIADLLPKFPNKVIRITAEAFSSAKTLEEYHNLLEQKLSRDAKTVYQLTKNLFKEHLSRT